MNVVAMEVDEPGGRSARAPDRSPDLNGSFTSLSAFEVLQLVAQLGSGVLEVDDGERARTVISLEDGTLTGATRGRLRDREAVLEVLTVKPRSFRYWKGSPDARLDHGRWGLQEVLLEAARLEDELELRAPHLPPANAPLRHRSDVGPGEDPLDCSAADIYRAVRDRTGVTREALEVELPLSAVRVRLGLAWLVQGHFLRERRAESAVQTLSLSGAPDWYQTLLAIGNGLRLLVGVPEGVDVEPMLACLARELQARTPPGVGLAHGPVFARIRPAAGGLVAITLVVLNRKSRYLFPSLSRGVELVVAADEIDERDLDPKTRVRRLARESLHERTLVEALRWFAEQAGK